MRSGITFQNGEPLTGDAVTTAYKAFIANALTGPVFSDVSSVQTTGPLTLTVHDEDARGCPSRPRSPRRWA